MAFSETEEPLEGGQLNAVVRVGDTVRRPAGSWTPVIHALLDHIRGRGFDHCPEPLGFDDRGREVLSYVAGDTVGWNLPWPDWVQSEELLAAMGRLTAQYHRAVADFRPRGVVSWQFEEAALQPGQIVCHDDLAPYNVVFSDGAPRCVIDWDLARPGTVESELAFVAWQWVPLHHPDIARGFGWTTPPDCARRLRLLLDSYGLPDRSQFVEAVIKRVGLNRHRMRRRAELGVPGYVELVRTGHVVGMEWTIDFLRDIGADLQERIG